MAHNQRMQLKTMARPRSVRVMADTILQLKYVMQDEAGYWIRTKQVCEGNGKSRLYLLIALIPASVHCRLLFGCDWYDRLKIFALKLYEAGLVSIITFKSSMSTRKVLSVWF